MWKHITQNSLATLISVNNRVSWSLEHHENTRTSKGHIEYQDENKTLLKKVKIWRDEYLQPSLLSEVQQPQTTSHHLFLLYQAWPLAPPLLSPPLSSQTTSMPYLFLLTGATIPAAVESMVHLHHHTLHKANPILMEQLGLKKQNKTKKKKKQQHNRIARVTRTNQIWGKQEIRTPQLTPGGLITTRTCQNGNWMKPMEERK